MNSENDTITQITRYIPILTILAISFGSLSLGTYYSSFHINIFSFLELNEIVFQTVKGFALIASTGIIYYLFIVMLLPTQYEAFSSIVRSNKNFVNALLTNKLIFTLTIILLLSSLSSGVLYYGYELISPKLYTLIFFPSTVTPIIFLSFLQFNRVYLRKYQVIPSNQIRVIFSITICLLLFGLFDGYLKVLLFKNDDKRLKNSVTVNNVLISSTSSYYYIGKTNKYVFFYNEKNKTTDVFPMAEVKKLTLYEK